MGLSGSGINEENHIVNGSWIAWLIDDSIGAILSVPFCPLPFCPRTVLTHEEVIWMFVNSMNWNKFTVTGREHHSSQVD